MIYKHKCDTCTKKFATCDAKEIVFNEDLSEPEHDPYSYPDKVFECDAYEQRMQEE